MFRRQPNAARFQRARLRQRHVLRPRKLAIEPLEDRWLLAVMTVTNLNDNSLANLAGGGLSLREAIKAINTATVVDGVAPTFGVFGTNDEIRFAPTLFAGGPQSIALSMTAGQLDLSKAMTITGPAANPLTINAGNGADGTFNTGDGIRIFNIFDGTAAEIAVTISGLRLTGGDMDGNGGAIRSVENLTLVDAEISGNATTSDGGGIYANGATTITSSTIAGNEAAFYGGGLAAIGTTTITGCRVVGNTATYGGGLAAGGTTTITNSTISGNTANLHGGGIRVDGNTTIAYSTIDGNNATAAGGGIYSETNLTDQRTTITNSTISGNTAGIQGGGIYNYIGLTVIEFSTITRNTAPAGMGSGVASFGLDDTLTHVRNSIIAGNTNSDVDIVNGAGINSFQSLDYNLIGTGNIVGSFNQPSDQTNKNPMLFALADNGGETMTHLPMPGSPAIDLGNPAVFPGVNGVPVSDQRGDPFSRVQDGDASAGARIDIGATEAENPNNGPRVVGLYVTNIEAYQLFDPNPSTDGPTPLVHSLTIRIKDLVPQMPLLPGDYNNNGEVDAADELIWMSNEGTTNPLPNDAFGGVIGPAQYNQWQMNFGKTLSGAGPTPAVNMALALNKAFYALVGDFTGNVPIVKVEVGLGPLIIGQPATADIRLYFAKPLADDRFTLTVSDSIRDSSGNPLDGDSNANQPIGLPTLPSGDGFAGGPFVARFTIDSRPEIGSWSSPSINVDTNGNRVWDPAPPPIGGDATNVDLSFSLPVVNADGSAGLGGFGVFDQVFAGKFVNSLIGAPLPSRLYDQLAAYGNSTALGGHRWIIDASGDGVVTIGTDILTMQPSLPVHVNFNVVGANPIAGNFNPAKPGDEIGLYNDGKWAFDINGNFVIDANDRFITGTLLGYPAVGDFDGDGLDDLAVFNNDTWYFDLANDGLGITNTPGVAQADSNGNDRDRTFAWGYAGPLEKPLAADTDQDGIDDIGLWVPAASPASTSQWRFLVSNTPTATLSAVTSASQFTAAGLKGAAIVPGDLVRVTGGVNIAAAGVVQTFNSTTGAITLVAPLASLPSIGSIVAVGGAPGSIAKLSHGFNPPPQGSDIGADFGGQSTLPVVGNFDPPVAAGGGGAAASSSNAFAAARTETAGLETLAEAVGESASMSIVDKAHCFSKSSRRVVIDSAVADLALTDLRLILLNHTAPGIQFDSLPPLGSPDAWPQANDAEHDLALELAWNDLG